MRGSIANHLICAQQQRLRGRESKYLRGLLVDHDNTAPRRARSKMADHRSAVPLPPLVHLPQVISKNGYWGKPCQSRLSPRIRRHDVASPAEVPGRCGNRMPPEIHRALRLKRGWRARLAALASGIGKLQIRIQAATSSTLASRKLRYKGDRLELGAIPTGRSGSRLCENSWLSGWSESAELVAGADDEPIHRRGSAVAVSLVSRTA